MYVCLSESIFLIFAQEHNWTHGNTGELKGTQWNSGKLRGEFLRSSSIFKFFEVVFHILSCWIKIRLNTEIHLPRLPWSCLKCNHIVVVVVWWWWWCFFFLDNNSTQTKLFCFVLLVAWSTIWRFDDSTIQQFNDLTI